MTWTVLVRRCGVAIGLCSLACSGNDETAGGSTTEASSSAGESTSTTTGDTSETDAASTASSTDPDSTGEPLPGEPARAVAIIRVEATSGVAIAIAKDGTLVQEADRNAPLPKHRDTAFRVYVDVDEASWVPRDLLARLTIRHADGNERTYDDVAAIAMDSSPTSADPDVLVGVLADDMRPGATFQVELFEAGTGWESLPPADVPPAALADGPAPIGIEASEQHMRVVIVPIAYTSATCTATPPVDEAALQPYEDALFQQNPLESLELEIHAPLVVDDVGLGVVDGLHVLVDRLVALRVDDDPDPNVYYYGLLDNCGACMQLPGGGCVTGLAAGIPGAAESDASLRVAAGVRTLYAEEVGPIAFVHEIGHSQGRRHVACPNTEPADVDPDFPHPDGDIGTWGFGIRDFMVYRGDLYGDYMSYCYPQWVSDYQWSATFERIRVMTELGDGAVVPPTDEMLIGTVDTDSGASRWWIEHGDVESADATADLVLLGDGIEVHATTAFVSPWSGGPWRTVRANLPDRAVIAQADAFALDLPELDLVIPLADVRPARIR